jgi:hypothetical protein
MAVRDRDVAPVRAGADTWPAVAQENVNLIRRVLAEAPRHPEALCGVVDDDAVWEVWTVRAGRIARCMKHLKKADAVDAARHSG